ncbi:MAG: class E sortase [Acidimicrobiales bacterium]
MSSTMAWLREHRAARLGLSGLSGALLLAAIGLIAFPLITNVAQGTNEGHLSKQLNSAAIRNEYLNGDVGIGQSLTRIKIPAIKVDVVVVQGTTESALQAGAGHYPSTPLPCTVGNVAIAGHRTTYGKPFANLDQLVKGDTVELDTPIGSCTYKVSGPPLTVLPNDTAVVANTPGKYTLTLTTCTPKYFATHRLVVHAVMSSPKPLSGSAPAANAAA